MVTFLHTTLTVVDTHSLHSSEKISATLCGEIEMKGIQKRTYKNGLVSYQAQVRIKGAKTISKSFRRITDAKLWKQKLEADIRRDIYFPETKAKRRTLFELIEKYKKDTFKHRKSLSSPTQTLNWWNNKIGTMYLSDVTTSIIREH